jgi:3'-phosphoadenosine 5'-phosphosulfate sulfotransferase (PAPS reductase)/FAD synthetase
MVTQTRIMEYYQHYGGLVSISFSGGKDSTALLDLARRCYPTLKPLTLTLVWNSRRFASLLCRSQTYRTKTEDAV